MVRRAALAAVLFAIVFAVAFVIRRAADSPDSSDGAPVKAARTPVAAASPTPVFVSGLIRVRNSIPALRAPTPEATATRTPGPTATFTVTPPPPTPPPGTPTPTVTIIEG
jgi:hypothetical protein